MQEDQPGTFIPLKPCKRGHKRRYLSNNGCCECQKLYASKHAVKRTAGRRALRYALPSTEERVAALEATVKILATTMREAGLLP